MLFEELPNTNEKWLLDFRTVSRDGGKLNSLHRTLLFFDVQDDFSFHRQNLWEMNEKKIIAPEYPLASVSPEAIVGPRV